MDTTGELLSHNLWIADRAVSCGRCSLGDDTAMTATEALARGRAAFEREAWSDAYTQLAAADRPASLEPDDLDRLATAAFLIGEDAASADARTRAHAGFSSAAIRFARPEAPSGSPLRSSTNQLSARRPADGSRGRAGCSMNAVQECVEHGFLLCALGLPDRPARAMWRGARRRSSRRRRIGSRFQRSRSDCPREARSGRALHADEPDGRRVSRCSTKSWSP